MTRVCMCVLACLRACVHACMHACVRARACVYRVFVSNYLIVPPVLADDDRSYLPDVEEN